jgi:hypothetical protein
VVESSLGVPTGCVAKLQWLNHWIVWVQLGRLEPIRHKRGLLGGCDAHTGGETIARVLIGTTSIRLSKDNHDSWGMCTTSTECKTVITVVLTVMSDMDPCMIIGT